MKKLQHLLLAVSRVYQFIPNYDRDPGYAGYAARSDDDDSLGYFLRNNGRNCVPGLCTKYEVGIDDRMTPSTGGHWHYCLLISTQLPSFEYWFGFTS